MRILTWNINGIRAALKKDLLIKIENLDVNIACFQESKAGAEIIEELILKGVIPAKYSIIYNSCSIKKGYSGVVNLIQDVTDFDCATSLGLEEFDCEGRYLLTTFAYNDLNIALINCYYPQGGRDYRIPYKLEFYKLIANKVKELKSMGYKCILTGDFNTTFADIDLARPKENRQTTGCLPIEREALNNLVELGLVDIFRLRNPELEGIYSYWDQITRARDRNVGWRIDFFLVDSDLIEFCSQIEVKMDILGSDHCPVILTLK